MGLVAVERGVRAGDVDAGVEVLLDELEANGELGAGERVGRLRAQIIDIARARASIWTQQPELAAVDLFAHTLALPELAAARERWTAELDARGPWLRPLRAQRADASVVAELRSSAELRLEWLVDLRFEGDGALVFELAEGPPRRWEWARARLERRPDLAPSGPRPRLDPRFEPGSEAPSYRPTPTVEPRPLPWPELGSADASVSADGRTIFVYGWYDDYFGLLQLVDEATLKLMRSHEFDRPVTQVIERPGSDSLLVVTYGGLRIVGPDGREWSRTGSTGRVAWSPSGRYVAAVDDGVVQVIDTRMDPRSTASSGGLPVCFSPDGARLVDGDALLDGRTGATIARLDLELGGYLEGGPAYPWFHVGTELIVCIHGGLALWDARTGAAVSPGEHMHVPHWEHIGYSPCGRWFVRGRGRSVRLGELPSTRTLAELEFDVEFERLTLASDAELIAAYGAGHVEVRDRSGALICRGTTPEPREPERFVQEGSFGFVGDDRRLRLDEPESRGWSSAGGDFVTPALRCEWDFASDPATVHELDAERSLPPGWSVAGGPVSVFIHERGAKIHVASAGPWLANPVEPRLLACPGGLFELREGT